MRKPKRAAPLYQRGKFKLDWDRKRDGSLRSPNLAIFWYDDASRRVRSVTTGTADEREAMRFLDTKFLESETGQAVCPTCGQVRSVSQSYLVTEAIEAYLLDTIEKPSAKAIRARLNHVLDYIATLESPAVQATAINEKWIEGFRKWAMKAPIVSPTGKKRQRTLSTIETAVVQLAAAINHAYAERHILTKANFRPIQFKEVNNTPKYRSDVEELAAMFCYAQGQPALHRFLALSVATLARPDAVHDFNVDTQWQGRVIELNPVGRRQTSKRRPTLPAARQMVPVLNGASGWFVGVKSVRRSWETMAETLGLPGGGQCGMKLIRRSMADLLRARLPSEAWSEIEMFLGHAKFDEVSSVYAPFRPDYLQRAKAGIEAIMAEIEQFVPLAFTGLAPDNCLAETVEPV